VGGHQLEGWMFISLARESGVRACFGSWKLKRYARRRRRRGRWPWCNACMCDAIKLLTLRFLRPGTPRRVRAGSRQTNRGSSGVGSPPRCQPCRAWKRKWFCDGGPRRAASRQQATTTRREWKEVVWLRGLLGAGGTRAAGRLKWERSRGGKGIFPRVGALHRFCQPSPPG
jgi:hypothetical protein